MGSKQAVNGTKPACVVGVGASVGGVDAFRALVANLPGAPGMAIVLVSHLDLTTYADILDSLAKATPMPVIEARHQMALEAGCIYTIPPNTTMLLTEGRLDLGPRLPQGLHLPIDAFFRSLAIDQRSRAIGVILSGTGSDGALGLQAIKAEGGITFAQDPETAEVDGMPRQAIAMGCVDLVKSTKEIAVDLARLCERIGAASPKEVDAKEKERGAAALEHADLEKIISLLHAAHGIDFTLYRHSTIKRRVLRRSLLLRMQSVNEYVRVLSDQPAELEALCQDILIKVTHFFRDPEVFEALKEQVFPALLANHAKGVPIRIWVPGCSTGEEAYSIAICLLEALSPRRPSAPIQIFGTDVSKAAIERARAGVFLENIAADLSPSRLHRFFTKSGKQYQISRAIRDMCIFSQHDLTRDPPFSRLDLVSCRNVLIYFEAALQKKILPLFHYALKPGGFLILGTSETAGGVSDLFDLIDKKHKIHVKISVTAHPRIDFAQGRVGLDHENTRTMHKRTDGPPGRLDAFQEADRLITRRYTPAGVIINADLQIVQFRGHTGPYLEPAPGDASLDVLKMARDGLTFELRAAIHKAKRTREPARAEGIRLRDGAEGREVAIEVIPLRDGLGTADNTIAHWFLVIFEEAHSPPRPDAAKGKGGGKLKRAAKSASDREVERLEQELLATKDYLQATVEEQEATNEQLKAANEELLSSNEELQSINEALETAKEELQSTNEELTTLNEALGCRNTELSRANDDLTNLLACAGIPIVMLGSDLRIRRFTPPAERLLNLFEDDVGRPIDDVEPRLGIPCLERLLTEVIETGSIREQEVQDREGRWYAMRIRPYRTTENRIDGAVMCMIDIDGLTRGPAGGS